MSVPKFLANDADSTFFYDDASDGTLASASASPAASGAASSGLTQALYLTESGDTAAISLDDIHQGQIGDCFLLSSIGEIALRNPGAIAKMITANANGTETVKLYLDHAGGIPTPGDGNLRAVSVTVTNVFASNSVNNGSTQDVVGNQKEIWPQVLEKAFATMEGGYSAISNGGNPAEAMEELTGNAATYYKPTSVTADQLSNWAIAKDLITFDTANLSNLPDNLVGDHAYMFEKVVGSGSTASVQLANPWGTDQPGLVPVSQFAKAFVEIDVGHLS